MLYFYDNHCGGGIYYENEPLDYDDLYCETCGDSDIELGGFENFLEAWDYLKDECDLYNEHGYKNTFKVLNVLCEAFDIDININKDSSENDIKKEVDRIIELETNREKENDLE